jgi:hypothetical protein
LDAISKWSIIWGFLAFENKAILKTKFKEVKRIKEYGRSNREKKI